MSKAENKRRIAWMAEFERLVTAARPSESGRIDWNGPTYHFNAGRTASDAAERYVEWRKRESV